MSVRSERRRDKVSGKVREYWMVHVVIQLPDGRLVQARKALSKTKVNKREAEAYERRLRVEMLNPSAVKPKEVPTLKQFWPTFLAWAKGERHKASGIHSKESIYRVHLAPAFDSKRLDQIDDAAITRIKCKLATAGRSRKTANNILGVLSKALRLAVKWKVLSQMPCEFNLKPVKNIRIDFYEFADYDRLVDAAGKVGSRYAALVLLGGDAGLRRSEIIGLRWCDVDFARGQLRIVQAQWKDTVDTPKSDKPRIVPMTDALTDALKRHRHLRSERVLCLDDGKPAPGHVLRDWLEAVQRRGGLEVRGSLHKLRHTFCSHLAMRGAPAKAIQELAGHADLATTMRYMHLSPAARDSAIALLNVRNHSNIAATIGSEVRN